MPNPRLVIAAFIAGLFIVAYLAVTTDDTNPQLGSGSRIPYQVEPLHYAKRVQLTTSTAAPTTVVRVRAARAPSTSVAPVGSLHDLIRQGFARFGPEVAEQAVRVAGCESTGDETGQHLDPNATGREGEVGTFQLHPKYQSSRAAKFGWTMADLYDPAKNIAVAADLYAQSGWRPWACRWAA